MIALLQRVTEARVRVAGEVVGEIAHGLLAFVCAEPGDSQATAARLLDRMLSFRMFADAAGKMNLSVAEAAGGLLLVPQFTLAADTSRGTRPSFSSAAPPELARELFDRLVGRARSAYPIVAAGRFAAHMRVELVNDGPVTFWVRSSGSA
jgi:D-tyrosyl-tRNA(Tyr) deacylase